MSIPPKISVSKYVGTIKGKVAIKIFQVFKGLKKQKYWDNHFLARGYFANTVSKFRDEETITKYVEEQGKEKECQVLHKTKQLTLF